MELPVRCKCQAFPIHRSHNIAIVITTVTPSRQRKMLRAEKKEDRKLAIAEHREKIKADFAERKEKRAEKKAAKEAAKEAKA